MLFNSPEYIFFFLPVIFIGYFYFNKKNKSNVSKYWLIFGSLFFYSWWNPIYLPIILSSMIFNYTIGNIFSNNRIESKLNKKILMMFGVLLNIALLGYFKYADFFLYNLNNLTGSDILLLHLALPLGISFFTLQQIAFLVDSYGGLIKEKNYTDYMLFVVFFPQLIAGPIVHHKEMMPQFADIKNKFISYENITKGIFLFSIGLFKKVVIADSFSKWANAGFDAAYDLNVLEAWFTSLSYTFQLYFDFSGYTDMAIGAALLFNIKLPQNFNSPYKSVSIIEFWSKWHMTLTRFLTAYIYNPVVKSFKRFSFHKAMFATLVTMFLAGIWHGAAWTFVVFGLTHGIALIINHYYKKYKFKMNKILAWFLTFNFLNISFIIFRANSLDDAWHIIKAMLFGDLVLNEKYFAFLNTLNENVFKLGAVFEHIDAKPKVITYTLLAFVIVLFFKNSNELMDKFKTNSYTLIVTVALFLTSVFMMSQVSQFLYFNF